jgi:hypothetical protein
VVFCVEQSRVRAHEYNKLIKWGWKRETRWLTQNDEQRTESKGLTATRTGLEMRAMVRSSRQLADAMVRCRGRSRPSRARHGLFCTAAPERGSWSASACSRRCRETCPRKRGDRHQQRTERKQGRGQGRRLTDRGAGERPRKATAVVMFRLSSRLRVRGEQEEHRGGD